MRMIGMLAALLPGGKILQPGRFNLRRVTRSIDAVAAVGDWMTLIPPKETL